MPEDDRAETKSTRAVVDEYLRREHDLSVDDLAGEPTSRLAFERDLGVRQARIAEADLKVVRMALEENRPLEALRTVNEALDRLDGELDAIEGLEGGLDPREDSDG